VVNVGDDRNITDTQNFSFSPRRRPATTLGTGCATQA
jgi:hypothetical protein